MGTTAHALAISPFLTGDPVRLDPPPASLEELTQVLELPPPPATGLLLLAPRVALLYALREAA